MASAAQGSEWEALADAILADVVADGGPCQRALAAACGPPGLFTEEFDVVQRQLRSNLPQAFVHALMLECATRLSAIAD